MKIQLKTDYLDCYDHWFDLSGEVVFKRIAEQSWLTSRTSMFEAFSALGLQRPRFARACLFPADELVVVYVDPYAHQGEGKLLMKAGDACRLDALVAHTAVERGVNRLSSGEVETLLSRARPRLPGAHEMAGTLYNYCASSYVSDYPGVTWRLLSCGGLRYWFRHESFTDWRSNAGDGDLFEVEPAGEGQEVPELPQGFEERILNPVWAIDFVAKKLEGGEVQLLAIDFNSAPRVSGTPLARKYPHEQLASGVKEAVEALHASGLATLHYSNPRIIDNNLIVLKDSLGKTKR